MKNNMLDGEPVTDSPDYRARAQKHAPKTQEEIQAAARQLAGQGHSDFAISAILKTDLTEIRGMLGDPSART